MSVDSEQSSLLSGRSKKHNGEYDDHSDISLRSRMCFAGTSILAIGIFFTLCFMESTGSSRQDMLMGSVGVFHEEQALPMDPKDTASKALAGLNIPSKRCDFVKERFAERDFGKDEDELAETYQKQSTSSNVFYRATAHIFWHDFVNMNLSEVLLSSLDEDFNTKDTWTWVTGDQHLSNFGAWKNRNKEIVFGVNDFDEAAIYDFQIDVLRLAVSVCTHALKNGMSDRELDDILHTLTDSYVHTVEGYVGNDKADLHELTPATSHGRLRHFLRSVENKNSHKKQLRKFTQIDPVANVRSFVKGPVGVADPQSKLASVPPDVYATIVEAFSSTKYGATLLKLGWKVHQWDDDFFRVIDIAERVGSGVGSYGTDRYYVLLQGSDDLLEETEDQSAVILDVKMEPQAAVHRVLSENDQAWYNVLFPQPAMRAIEAQRRLTSYVDPFTGWILLTGDGGVERSYTVRQRSPWKEGFDIDSLKSYKDFNAFVSQLGVSTATSHVRGTVARAPGAFKTVVANVLGPHRSHWGSIVRDLAKAYHEQVIMDFECFQDIANSDNITAVISNTTTGP